MVSSKNWFRRQTILHVGYFSIYVEQSFNNPIISPVSTSQTCHHQILAFIQPCVDVVIKLHGMCTVITSVEVKHLSKCFINNNYLSSSCFCFKFLKPFFFKVLVFWKFKYHRTFDCICNIQITCNFTRKSTQDRMKTRICNNMPDMSKPVILLGYWNDCLTNVETVNNLITLLLLQNNFLKIQF